jgi:hypothetical protein
MNRRHGPPLDRLARPLRDLRVSVTDRCNFRCLYCMPREVFGADYPFLDRAEVLTFEEITRLVWVFATLGDAEGAADRRRAPAAARYPTPGRDAVRGRPDRRHRHDDQRIFAAVACPRAA